MDSFDPESGQIYKETIMPNKKPIPWDRKCAAERMAPYTPPSDGVKTLQSLAMQQLVRRANSLQPETLENVPAPIALRIWTAIRREWRESFHVWTVFVKAGLHERTFRHSVQLPSHDCRMDVCGIFSKLSSQSCAWVVDLTIGDNYLNAAQYKEVSGIANLQNLHVQFTQPKKSGIFDDRIVQAWSTRAEQEAAFTHLEFISITNAPGATENIFKHLSKFPALTVFLVCNTAIRRKKRHLKAANTQGWQHDDAQLDSYTASQEGLRTDYSRSGHVVRLVGPARPRRFRDWLRLRSTRSLSSAPRLDAMMGNSNREAMLIDENDVLYFERDQSGGGREATPEVTEISRPEKRRKMNEAKGAELTAMLKGG